MYCLWYTRHLPQRGEAHIKQHKGFREGLSQVVHVPQNGLARRLFSSFLISTIMFNIFQTILDD